jgi:hypothetical protein
MDDAQSDSGRGKNPNSLANLKPFQPGVSGNKTGTNGFKKAQARLFKFMAALDKERGEGKSSRTFHLLDAAYQSALIIGPKGASDRKLLLEQLAGKARQQFDLSSEDGSMTPVRTDGILSALQAAIAAKQSDEDRQGESGQDDGSAAK